MKTTLVTSQDQAEDGCWEEYKKKRDELLSKVLPKNDINDLPNKTDFLL